MGFIRIGPANVPAKFEVRGFTRSIDNRRYPKNFGTPWIRPCTIFSKIFNGLLPVPGIRIGPVNVPARFEVCSFTCS